MSQTDSQLEIKTCCAGFYQSDAVRLLLGDVLHPGGLALTRHLGEVLALRPQDRVLDVACGRGASAVHLASHFACHVTGLDYGSENVAAAEQLAAERGVDDLTTFKQGDAEELPFDAASFDVVISECSFCTFPDKRAAATETARVLRAGGRMGLTDMTVNGSLPDDLQNLLAWVACVAGAGPPHAYVAVFEEAGFVQFTVEDHGGALLDMVADVRRKLIIAELTAGLGALDPAGLDLDEGKRLAHRADEIIRGGVVGYALITAKKSAP